MDRISNFPNRPDFRWGVAALPYTPNPSQPKNVSGRISVHGLYMDSESKNKEQAWQVFKYWMRPDANQKYVWSDGHVVSPLVKTGSEWSLKEFQTSVNVADAKAFSHPKRGTFVDFEADREVWPQLGFNVYVLEPGRPNCKYHRESVQEAFLVLSGECILIVEGEEKTMKSGDFFHCPPGTEHVFVGAGDGPCAVLMIGSRREISAHQRSTKWRQLRRVGDPGQ